MKTRKILGAVFSLLIVLSIAFSMTPFLTTEVYGATCDRWNGFCDWAPYPWTYVSPGCCCNLETHVFGC